MQAEQKNNKKLRHTFQEIFCNKNVLSALLITSFLLILFHLGATATLPGITLSDDYKTSSQTFSGMLNLLAGGGLSRMSMFAVGVGPYITAQIIVQLLSSDLVKPLSRLQKTGERGRRKLEVITRIITLPFCIAQAYAVIALMLNNNQDGNITIFGAVSINDISPANLAALIIIFIAGTYIAIFIGDIITKRGVGNGITLIILSGIVSSLIANFQVGFEWIAKETPIENQAYQLSVILSCLLYVLFFVFILIAIIFVNASVRKIPIQQTGQGLTSDVNNLPFLPIKLNASGVIPVIFASSIMTIPQTISQFLPQDEAKWFIDQYLTMQSWSGVVIYVIFIILFSFFYSYIQVNPAQMAENFEKSGRFIPGVKSGIETEKHITKVLNRINWIGSPFLAIIAALPYMMSLITSIPSGLALGGTGLIIIVAGALELWSSIKSASTSSGYNVTRTKIESKYIETEVDENKVSQIW